MCIAEKSHGVHSKLFEHFELGQVNPRSRRRLYDRISSLSVYILYVKCFYYYINIMQHANYLIL